MRRSVILTRAIRSVTIEHGTANLMFPFKTPFTVQLIENSSLFPSCFLIQF